MRIQTNIISTIGLAHMVVLSVTASNTFSFAASTNNTKNQSATPSITTTGPSSSTCTNTDNYLWNHVYNVNNGQPWGMNPGRLQIIPDSQYKYGSCVTVTGQVYSIYPPPSPERGTHDEPDGDLHFTLALDQKYWGLSNPNDPTCTPSPSHGLPAGCKNIIVEVICHKTPASSYMTHGDFCKDVKPAYPSGQFPKQGDKLTVSGKLVKDEGEGKWNEIHPASYIH
jgi:hypothetical protein